ARRRQAARPSASSRRRRPARHVPGEPVVRRLPVLALVVAILVAGGLASSWIRQSSPPTPTRPATTSLAVMAAPTTATASSWYCTGASGPGNPVARGTLYMVNSSEKPVKGTLTAYDSTGHRVKESITVPALGQATATPGTIASGAWLASRIDLDGGGVAVHQLVAGPTGWSMAPCSTQAGTSWYFASGATTLGNQLYVSLFNPTKGTAVVDLTFVTGRGGVQPAPFQGLIIQPNAVVTAEVASYVQDQSAVATVVHARSGRVVASELQVHTASGQSGVSLRLGALQPSPQWYVPSSQDATGGTSQLAVFNPTRRPEHVTVATRLASGPVAPLHQTMAPHSTWTLDLGSQTRIPVGTQYALTVDATGGGVVVDRVAAAPAGAPAPQWGAVTAVAGHATASPTGRWTLPNPALNSVHVEAGAQPSAVVLFNPGDRTVRATVTSLGTGGLPLTGAGTLEVAPHALVVVPAKGIADGGLAALRVTADRPLAATEDVAPAGLAGIVAGSAVPQA
ncbi:MAG: DUF5719 family protein, partial [Acidimicrobiales bacterium]